MVEAFVGFDLLVRQNCARSCTGTRRTRVQFRQFVRSHRQKLINTICNLLERREVGGNMVGKTAVNRLYIGQSDTEGYGNRVAAKWGHLCHDLFRRQNFPKSLGKVLKPRHAQW